MRHGNTFNAGETCVMVGSRTDLPLTEFGHQQAHHLARYFKIQNINFDKIYCGNLMRQRQTAQAISTKVISGISALDEIDYGAWEGLTNEAIRSKWPNEFEAWTQQGIWPDLFGERLDHKKRVLNNWVASLGLNNKTILGVSSGGVIRLFASLYNDIQAGKINTGHFCELLIRPSGLEIVRWNQAPT